MTLDFLDHWSTHAVAWLLFAERAVRVFIWLARRLGVKKVTVELDLASLGKKP